jgi:hypothetical protein
MPARNRRSLGDAARKTVLARHTGQARARDLAGLLTQLPSRTEMSA